MATVDLSGYTARTRDEVLQDIYDAWLTKPALQNLITSPDTPQAQLAEVFAEAIFDLEAVIGALISNRTRSTAVGQFLDDIGAITGILRQQPTRSTVTATVNLNAGITLPAGSQASSSIDDESIYETITDVTNDLTSAADIEVEMRAVREGSDTFAAAGNLTVITSPVVGWNSVTNAADSSQGTDQETDAEYRLRQEQSLSAAGAGTSDALSSALVGVEDVESVSVLENTSNMTDALGLPPHTFEPIVEGGDNDEIAQAIWDNKPLGIESVGTETGTAIDAAGNPQTVAFSRPTLVPIYIDISLTTNGDYPGDVAFETAFVQAANTFFGLGDTVVRAKLIDLAFQVAGVLDVTLLELGTAPSPSGTTNLSVTARQEATFSTTDLTVV